MTKVLILGSSGLIGSTFYKYLSSKKSLFVTGSYNANKPPLANLIKLLDQGNETFALRKQDHLNKEQALYLASCKSKPQDISLYF